MTATPLPATVAPGLGTVPTWRLPGDTRQWWRASDLGAAIAHPAIVAEMMDWPPSADDACGPNGARIVPSAWFDGDPTKDTLVVDLQGAVATLARIGGPRAATLARHLVADGLSRVAATSNVVQLPLTEKQRTEAARQAKSKVSPEQIVRVATAVAADFDGATLLRPLFRRLGVRDTQDQRDAIAIALRDAGWTWGHTPYADGCESYPAWLPPIPPGERRDAILTYRPAGAKADARPQGATTTGRFR